MGSRRTEGGSRHLRFEKQRLEKGKKLHKYIVYNDEFNQEIGVIHWRGGWHQYVFTADTNKFILQDSVYELGLSKEQEKKLEKILGRWNIDMSRSCHKEIDSFIDNLMEVWRNARKTK